MHGLEGKVAVVTGGSGGIGRACVTRLSDEGAAVIVSDINVEGGSQVSALLQAAGRRALFLEHDVSIEDQWSRLVERCVGEFGSLDILVNCAGISGTGGDVEHFTMENYHRVISVNQTGTLLGMRAVAEPMRSVGAGAIVNISSVLGVGGGFGLNVAYHASKGAIIAMTKNAAVFWGSSGIRVNCVVPSAINTRPIEPVSPRGQIVVSATPMGRRGLPEEVAAVVSFLVNDDSSYMTGSEVFVDGGFMSW